MKTPQGTPESTWDQSVRTQGHSGQQLSSFCPTANANDLSKASKGPRAHPQNGGGRRKLDQEAGDEESASCHHVTVSLRHPQVRAQIPHP